jgi:transcriptional regulator with XRE-family HTH domain
MATMDLGSRLLSWLRVKNVSQAQLAEKVGLSPAAISKIVNGKNDPTYANLRKFQDALGLTETEFHGPIPEVPSENATTDQTTTAA